MLLEALEHCLTPCPHPWREMGYLREQIALSARERRNRKVWAPHFAATRKAVLEAMIQCSGRQCVLLLGAGLQHDLPLAELSEQFGEVWLADLVHRPWTRAWGAGRGGQNLQRVEFDVTGVLKKIHEAGEELSEEQFIRWVVEAQPGLPQGLKHEPDLIVSANLCSQLMLLPVEWIERRAERSERFLERMEAAAAQRHIEWLSQRAGLSLLVGERAHLRVSAAGRDLSKEAVPGLACLSQPESLWRWRLAPIPERSREYHVEAEVGAWLL